MPEKEKHRGSPQKSGTIKEAIQKDNVSEVKEFLTPKILKEQSLNEYKDSLLFLAIENQSINTVEFLLCQNVPVNYEFSRWLGPEGQVPILHAAKKGNIQIVDMLLNEGADINSKNYFGHAPLDLAIENHNHKLVEFLISKGASVFPYTLYYDCYSPVFTAAKSGNAYALKLLLKKGAIVDTINGEGENALIYAARDGNKEVAEILIKAGLDLNQGSSDGSKPLHWALLNRKYETARILIDNGADVNAIIPYLGRYSPLHLSVKNPDVTKFLISKGADIDYKDYSGNTALSKAMREGNIETVKILINAGAEIQLLGNDIIEEPEIIMKKDSRLYDAVCRLDDKEVYELLESGTSQSAKNDSLFSTINMQLDEEPVKLKKREKIINLLLHYGADTNVKDEDGLTSLFRVAAKLDEKLTRILIKRKADIHATDREGQTIVHFLIRVKRFENGLKMAEFFIDKGIDVNSRDNKGETPLHEAALKGKVESAKMLIKKGAKVNSRDKKGRTPLHCLSDREYREMRRFADYTQTANNYRRDYDGYEKTAEVLIKNGAKVNMRDKRGKTPLYYAKRYGYIKTAKLLERHGAKL